MREHEAGVMAQPFQTQTKTALQLYCRPIVATAGAPVDKLCRKHITCTHKQKKKNFFAQNYVKL